MKVSIQNMHKRCKSHHLRWYVGESVTMVRQIGMYVKVPSIQTAYIKNLRVMCSHQDIFIGLSLIELDTTGSHLH